jgi:hypothetical protein
VTPVSLTVAPISDALQRHLDAALGRVPADKKGRFYAGATLTGVEAGVGWKLSEKWDASAWYGREWRGGAQEGGVRVQYTW